MKTMILALLLAMPLFSQASYEDYRLVIYTDSSNLVSINTPRSQAQTLFYILGYENNNVAKVIYEDGYSRKYRVQSKRHPLLSCQLFEYSYNGPITRTFNCEFNVNVSWSAYRSYLPTDFQNIKDYTFDYKDKKPFQWKGAPAKALFEQLVVDKYNTEKTEIVGTTTMITRTVSNLGCVMKSDSGEQEYSCWIEN